MPAISVLNVEERSFEGGALSDFNLLNCQTLIIKASGTNPTISGNFNVDSANVLVNFSEAETLSIRKTFGFSILAPFTNITVTAGGVDGTVVGNNITQSIEFRQGFADKLPNTTTPVPLPAGGVLLLAGLGAAVAARRFRRAA